MGHSFLGALRTPGSFAVFLVELLDEKQKLSHIV